MSTIVPLSQLFAISMQNFKANLYLTY